MGIGEVAAELGLQPHVLRQWESLGLLTPTRGLDGRRCFDTDQLVRARLIVIWRSLGFSLASSRELFPTREASRQSITDARGLLAVRRRRLDQMSGYLDHVADNTHQDQACAACLTITASLEW